MKHLRDLFIFIVVSGSLTIIITHYYYYPCTHPVTYHLGNIDPRFNLSPQEAKQDLDVAQGIWNSASSMVLMEQSPSSSLILNFVYDNRQSLVTQISTEKNQVDSGKSTLDAQISAFSSKVASYKSRVQALNAAIASWNSKGGAPPDIFNQLIAEQKSIQQEGQSLQNEASRLSKSTTNFNLQVSQLNTTIDSFNTLLSQKPEEGIFDPTRNTIEIYFVTDHNELIHTLAHELGHARGLDHVSGTSAIMNAFSNKSVVLSTDDQNELTRACARISLISRFKLFVNYLQILIRKSPVFQH